MAQNMNTSGVLEGSVLPYDPDNPGAHLIYGSPHFAPPASRGAHSHSKACAAALRSGATESPHAWRGVEMRPTALSAALSATEALAAPMGTCRMC